MERSQSLLWFCLGKDTRNWIHFAMWMRGQQSQILLNSLSELHLRNAKRHMADTHQPATHPGTPWHLVKMREQKDEVKT